MSRRSPTGARPHPRAAAPARARSARRAKRARLAGRKDWLRPDGDQPSTRIVMGGTYDPRVQVDELRPPPSVAVERGMNPTGTTMQSSAATAGETRPGVLHGDRLIAGLWIAMALALGLSLLQAMVDWTADHEIGA